MKTKFLTAVFIALVAVCAFLAVTFSGYEKVAFADGEEPAYEGFTYEETFQEDYNRVFRTYHVGDEAVNTVKYFKAPDGYIVTLSCSPEQLDAVIGEINKVPDASLASSWFAIYKCVNGSYLYSYSFGFYSSDNEARDNIREELENYPMYTVSDLTSTVKISGYLEVEVSSSDGKNYRLRFYFDEYEIKPLEDGDVISLGGYLYYDTSVEASHFDVRHEINEEVFNDHYGLPTNGREVDPYSESGYRENYTVQYFVNGSAMLDEIRSLDEYSKDGIEFENFPEETMYIQAVLSFYSGTSEEYKFYSNVIEFFKYDVQLLVDGFINRFDVGVGNEHVFSLVNVINGEKYTPTEVFWSIESLTYGDEKMYDEYLEEHAHDQKLGYTFNDAGEYRIRGSATCQTGRVTVTVIKEIVVTAQIEEPVYTDLTTALTFDLGESVNAVIGGNGFTITANIADDVINDISDIEFDWHTASTGIISYEPDGASVKIIPLKSGLITIDLTVKGDTVGTLVKSFPIRVIDFETADVEIKIPDEFHKTGVDLSAQLFVNGYSDFVNFNPEWIVTDVDGKYVTFNYNGDGTITIPEPPEGEYTVQVAFLGKTVTNSGIKVRDIDMDKLVRTYLPFVAIFVVILGILSVFFRMYLKNSYSLDKNIHEIVKLVSDIDLTGEGGGSPFKKLKRIDGKIVVCMDTVESLNVDGLGQYDQIYKYLKASHDIVRATLKNKKDIDTEKLGQIVAHLAEVQLATAERLSKDLEIARDRIIEQHRQFNLKVEASSATAQKKNNPKKQKNKKQ